MYHYISIFHPSLFFLLATFLFRLLSISMFNSLHTIFFSSQGDHYRTAWHHTNTTIPSFASSVPFSKPLVHFRKKNIFHPSSLQFCPEDLSYISFPLFKKKSSIYLLCEETKNILLFLKRDILIYFPCYIYSTENWLWFMPQNFNFKLKWIHLSKVKFKLVLIQRNIVFLLINLFRQFKYLFLFKILRKYTVLRMHFRNVKNIFLVLTDKLFNRITITRFRSY